MNTPSIQLQRRGRVALVTLDRGDGQNRLDTATMEALRDTALTLASDAELAAVVIHGKGAFSAGIDLSTAADAGLSLVQRRERAKLGPAMCKAWEDLEPYTIAAIEGYCVGGAAALAAALDWRVLGRGAFLRLPEVPLGMNMSWHTIPRLVAQIGPARAKQYVMLGHRITAAQALDWGLCEEVVDDGASLDRALLLAQEIEGLPPLPARMTKQAVNAVANALAPLAAQMDRDQFLLTLHSRDLQEGVTAFLQKRSPKFTGN